MGRWESEICLSTSHSRPYRDDCNMISCQDHDQSKRHSHIKDKYSLGLVPHCNPMHWNCLLMERCLVSHEDWRESKPKLYIRPMGNFLVSFLFNNFSLFWLLSDGSPAEERECWIAHTRGQTGLKRLLERADSIDGNVKQANSNAPD